MKRRSSELEGTIGDGEEISEQPQTRSRLIVHEQKKIANPGAPVENPTARNEWRDWMPSNQVCLCPDHPPLPFLLLIIF